MKRLLLLFLIACSGSKVVFDGASFDVELARTADEKAKGLMFRESLHDYQGMLFVFDGEQQRSFWMKNTLISLDMIFISENGTVVDVQTAVPCKSDPCRLYVSPPARYVLEVNAGLAGKNSVGVGSQAKITLR
ncbi:DUF192 domain-containing protein [Candidatus Woesearchaeota archaeon]|nr:DUF192 domain-containing protein [Candidatus Woesearchaeota archaeon]